MSQEYKAKSLNGWLIVPFIVAGWLGGLYSIGMQIFSLVTTDKVSKPFMIVIGGLAIIVAIILNCGVFALQPGQARVLILFGKYIGTVRKDGLHFVNPFCTNSLNEAETDLLESSDDSNNSSKNILSHHAKRSIISVRARTFTGDRLKVNDKMGNPIEIATVIVWRVADTARAVFDVDDYEAYVSMQTETALRHVASMYAYDHMENDDSDNVSITLRSNIEEVSDKLKEELTRKLDPAGVVVEDARLTHLAYAPEIAQAMLRRQQAEAVIAARQKIVEGAVSMVEMALNELGNKNVVEFDDERKAAMASNLMVVLCGDSETQPVINTGSLYQ